MCRSNLEGVAPFLNRALSSWMTPGRSSILIHPALAAWGSFYHAEAARTTSPISPSHLPVRKWPEKLDTVGQGGEDAGGERPRGVRLNQKSGPGGVGGRSAGSVGVRPLPGRGAGGGRPVPVENGHAPAAGLS